MIDAPSSTMPLLSTAPHPQQATVLTDDSDAVQPVSRKRKDKSKLQRLTISTKTKPTKSSSSTTLNLIKQTLSASPKLHSKKGKMSSSMWTLSTENGLNMKNGLRRSTLSLNSPTSSPTASIGKKQKWYKKFLSPNNGSANKLSADSDSSLGIDKTAKKKKSWYRKRFRSSSKNRERELAKEI